MNINKNNYEAYFLDYHEGNLTPLQVADLFLFIAQHPEFKKEFEGFENVSLEDYTSCEFENKSNLKKEITLENRGDYFIRSVESNLNTTEEDLLAEFLKQNPQFLTEFELFQKTRLTIDDSIVFENKNGLKKSLSSEKYNRVGEEMMISAIEGLLSPAETKLLNLQIADDLQLEKEFVLYQQTKLTPDTSIVFESKETLKHKDKKTISFYYYLAAAATILLLFGLFFLFNNNDIQPELADIGSRIKPNAPIKIENRIKTEKQIEKKDTQPNGISSFVLKKKNFKDKKRFQNKSLEIIPDETPNLSIMTKKDNNELFITPNDSLLILPPDLIQQTIIPNTVTLVEKKKEMVKEIEFISLRELAVEKIKEKLLDKSTVVVQKKNGRLKKITGWDIAQVFTSGISKLSGRDVELKPYYNEEGTVTAYALSAGDFQISRGR